MKKLIIVLLILIIVGLPSVGATTTLTYPNGNTPTYMLPNTWYTSNTQSFGSVSLSNDHCTATYGNTSGGSPFTTSAMYIAHCTAAYNYTGNSSYVADCPAGWAVISGSYPSWSYYFNSANKSFVYGQLHCSYSGVNTIVEATSIYYRDPSHQFDINFTGYPLDGYAPLDIAFTISNFTSGVKSGSTVSWTFGDGKTETSTSEKINHTYQSPGIYTVSLQYFNLSNTSMTITKTNYVLASLASGMVVNLDVKDAQSGALIQDSSVGIRNTTTGVWRNTTAPTGLVYFSTTDPGYLYPLTLNQSITLAANKTGYAPASTTFNIPYNDYRARLFLMPLTVVNATGTGTVVANVIRNKDGLTASGISVVMDTGQAGITNSAGTTTLYNVSAGTRYATVTDPDGGYQSTKYAFNLTAGETKLIVIQLVRVGETPVPTFGSPTPTPTRTYDPNDPTSPVYGNYTASQINEQGGAGVLGMLMQLIQLWPIVIIGAFMKFLKSAFS